MGCRLIRARFELEASIQYDALTTLLRDTLSQKHELLAEFFRQQLFCDKKNYARDIAILPNKQTRKIPMSHGTVGGRRIRGRGGHTQQETRMSPGF
jgi:hypothetical protein